MPTTTASSEAAHASVRHSGRKVGLMHVGRWRRVEGSGSYPPEVRRAMNRDDLHVTTWGTGDRAVLVHGSMSFGELGPDGGGVPRPFPARGGPRPGAGAGPRAGRAPVGAGVHGRAAAVGGG